MPQPNSLVQRKQSEGPRADAQLPYANLIEILPGMQLVTELDRLFGNGQSVNLGIPKTLTENDINYILDQIYTSLGRMSPFAQDGYKYTLRNNMHDMIMEQLNQGNACVVLFNPGSRDREASYSITTK